MSRNQYLHEVAITAIVVKEGKYLITRRAKMKKKFPGRWTVPGGRLEVDDYASFPKDTKHHWYNVIGRTLRREIKEEVGLSVGNVRYLTSITMIVGDYPTLILSFMADYAGGDVVCKQDELDEYAWVTLEEAKRYDLIEGIYEELVMAEKQMRGEEAEWQQTQ